MHREYVNARNPELAEKSFRAVLMSCFLGVPVCFGLIFHVRISEIMGEGHIFSDIIFVSPFYLILAITVTVLSVPLDRLCSFESSQIRRIYKKMKIEQIFTRQLMRIWNTD